MRAPKGETFVCVVCRTESEETAGFFCKHRLMRVEKASVVKDRDGNVVDCQAVVSSGQSFKAAAKV